MRIIIYCVLAILWPAMNSYAQSPPAAIRPLSIGDTVPNIEFNNIINFPVSKIHLSDLKGKLVILDFWSTFCGACIELFPHLNSLQDQFKNDLQIILVNAKSKSTHDDRNKIERLFDRLRQQNGLSNKLPIVFGNDTADQYFPCKYIPHEVWIDKTGKVISITSSTEVTSSNIQSIIEGGNPRMHIKKDIPDYDNQQPLVANEEAKNAVIYQSLFTGYREGIGYASGVKTDTGNLFKGLYFYNSPLMVFCKDAFNDILNLPENQIILDVADPVKFKGEINDTSIYQNSFCYDLTLPGSTREQLNNCLREDLYRAFHITAKRVKKKMRCYNMEATDSVRKSFTKGGKPGVNLQRNAINKYISNLSPGKVVEMLNGYFDRPLFNNTNLKRAIDLRLPFDLNDKQALIDSLKSAGFRFVPVEKELPVAILSDKGK